MPKIVFDALDGDELTETIHSRILEFAVKEGVYTTLPCTASDVHQVEKAMGIVDAGLTMRFGAIISDEARRLYIYARTEEDLRAWAESMGYPT